MKMKALSFITFLCLSLSIAAQQKEQTVLTVNNKDISLREFENVFKKNNNDPDTSPEGLDEYMDLFIKYKLKVTEAEALGMDTLSSFKKELAGYRTQLAAPYLTDEDALDKLVKQAYEHLKQEANASHILIKTTGTDTLEAYKRIMEIKKKLADGADFESMAKKYSQDPSAKSNGGELGYFSGMQMVWPFEKAVFESEEGAVSGPIKTSFGYHLIKVNDKRPSRGKRKTAHILIKTENVDSALAAQKADEVYQRIQQGESFEELAKKYSDDKGSAKKGGVLPEFGVGKMVKEYEQAAFALESEGDVSKPVQSSYGYHIIKLLEKKGVPDFEQVKPAILKRIKKDDRSQIARNSFIKTLKEEYDFKRIDKNVKPFYKWVDDRVFKGTWEVPAKVSDKYVATWADTGITQKQFAEHIFKLQREAEKEDITYFVDVILNKFAGGHLIAFENERLEEKYPEFKALMQEYRDGILLFDLMNEKVWNKAIKDTSGLKQFFTENQDQFMWKERAEAVIYKSEDAKLLKKVGKKLRKGNSEAEILAEYTEDDKLLITTESILEEKGESEILDLFPWKTGVSEVKVHNDRNTLVHIKKILPAGPKTLDEARGAAIAAYQNHLEKEWLNELKKKYSIEVNKEVLYSLQ